MIFLVSYLAVYSFHKRELKHKDQPCFWIILFVHFSIINFPLFFEETQELYFLVCTFALGSEVINWAIWNYTPPLELNLGYKEGSSKWVLVQYCGVVHYQHFVQFSVSLRKIVLPFSLVSNEKWEWKGFLEISITNSTNITSEKISVQITSGGCFKLQKRLFFAVT